ncbi:hypothetical protein NUKP68_24490 [Klebsiella variicola]|nr:hypothetical protein NUKP68_24490 [Klebsiella variicola]
MRITLQGKFAFYKKKYKKMLLLGAWENGYPIWIAANYMNLIVNILDDAENIILEEVEFF